MKIWAAVPIGAAGAKNLEFWPKFRILFLFTTLRIFHVFQVFMYTFIHVFQA